MTPAHTLLAALSKRARLDEVLAWISLGLGHPGIAPDGEEDLACLLRHNVPTRSDPTKEPDINASALALLDAGAEPFALKGPQSALGWAAQHDMGALVQRLLTHVQSPTMDVVVRQILPQVTSTGHFITDLAAHDKYRALKAALACGVPMPPAALNWATVSTIGLLVAAGAQEQPGMREAWADRLNRKDISATTWREMNQKLPVSAPASTHTSPAIGKALGSMLVRPEDTAALVQSLELLKPGQEIPFKNAAGKMSQGPLLWAVGLTFLRVGGYSNPGNLEKALITSKVSLLSCPPDAELEPGISAKGLAWLIHRMRPTLLSSSAIVAWSGNDEVQLWHAAHRAGEALESSVLIKSKNPVEHLSDVWLKTFPAIASPDVRALSLPPSLLRERMLIGHPLSSYSWKSLSALSEEKLPSSMLSNWIESHDPVTVWRLKAGCLWGMARPGIPSHQHWKNFALDQMSHASFPAVAKEQLGVELDRLVEHFPELMHELLQKWSSDARQEALAQKSTSPSSLRRPRA